MRRIPIALLTVLLLSPLLTTSHLFAQEELECSYDLSGRSYRFYHFGDLSGPYAFITTPVLAGFEDAIAYFNANGGLCGATIEADYRDTGASGAAAQAAWDEFTGRGDANVVFLYLTEDSELLRDQAAEQQIPIVVATSSTLALYGDSADEPAWVFGATPLYQDQLGAFCDYISEHWEQYGIEGDPVIGHVSWIGAFGEASDTDESRAYCASKGVGYAGAAYYFPGLPDISTQVQRVLDDGANILYTTSLATGPAQLGSTVEAMGIRDQVVLAGPNWVLDTSVISLGGESVAGIIGQLPYYWWDEIEQPGIQLVTNYWAQHRLATAQDPLEAFQIRNIAYLLAWVTVDFYRQFMTIAINEVGPDAVTGQTVYDILTSDREFSTLHGVMRIRYGPNDRSPHRTRFGTIQFIESEGSITPTIVPLTDWVDVPDLIPGGADVPK